jgi:recombination protein RecT
MSAPVQTPGTAVAKREAAPLSFASPKEARHSLMRLGDVLAPLLPRGVGLEQFAASVYFQMKRTPQLAECSTDSLLEAIQKAARSGLELGATCYILPFKNRKRGTMEATYVADYKGTSQKMIASGKVRAVDARVVREGDTFEYEYGLDEKLVHLPVGGSTKPITHAYVILKLPHGERTFLVMDAGEIDAIRQSYSRQWKEGPLPAWYAKKVVINQIAKTIPDPRLLAHLHLTESLEAGEDTAALAAGAQIAIPATTDDDDEPQGDVQVYHGRPGRMVATEPYDDDAEQQRYAEEQGS